MRQGGIDPRNRNPADVPVSQGSVATRLRRAWIFSHNVLLSFAVNAFRTLVELRTSVQSNLEKGRIAVPVVGDLDPRNTLFFCLTRVSLQTGSFAVQSSLHKAPSCPTRRASI